MRDSEVLADLSGERDGRTFEPRVERLGDDVYAYVQPDGGWYVNNTGFIVGPAAIIAVDSAATETRTRAFLEAIAATASLPVAALVNTHWHGDHTNGNYLFRDSTIIAHETTRRILVESGQRDPDPSGNFPQIKWGNLEPAPPTLTYNEGITLWAGGLRCDVFEASVAAHTTSDSVVWVSDRQVLFAGDLVFNGCAPLVSAGSVSGTLKALGELVALSPETIVPGHGDVCGPDALDRMTDYLAFVQEVAGRGHRTGKTPLDAARDVSEHPFAQLPDGERLVANLHRAYAEIDGAKPGAAIDLSAARRDMVSFHGGPLACHA